MGSMRLQRTTLLAHFAVKGKAFALRILTGKKHPQIKLKRLQKVWMDIWVVGTSNQFFISGSQKQSSYLQNSVLCDMSTLCSPFYFFYHWLLTGQFCMKMLGFQTWYSQLKNDPPVCWKGFSFFRKCFSKWKYWKGSKFLVIVT